MSAMEFIYPRWAVWLVFAGWAGAVPGVFPAVRQKFFDEAQDVRRGGHDGRGSHPGVEGRRDVLTVVRIEYEGESVQDILNRFWLLPVNLEDVEALRYQGLQLSLFLDPFARILRVFLRLPRRLLAGS